MTKIAYLSPKRLMKSLAVIPAVFCLYLFFIALFNRGPADYDLWGYLSFGRVFWEDGFFPYRDLFSYTPTKLMWVYHEWLTGVVFFWLMKHLGPASLQLLRYTLAIFTIYLIFITARKRGASLFSIIIALIPSIVLISFGYFPVRAQVFTFFFFTLTLYLLESYKKSGNVAMLGCLPLVQIFWCNLHGGFVSGLGLIFLYALGESLLRKKIAVAYLVWGVISVSATLINPYGLEYWVYTAYAVSMPRTEITEWYSVLTALKSNIYVFPAVTLLVTAPIIVFFSMTRKRDISELLVIAAVIYLGMAHVRHGVLFGLVLGAYLPLYLTEYAETLSGKYRLYKNLFKAGLAVCASFLVIAYFYVFTPKQITLIPTFKFFVSADDYPVKAVHWMKDHQIKGNILPHFEWGEYLMWSLYPDCRVAMDGRYETVYQDHVHKEYFEFLSGRDGWDRFLNKYPHDMILLKARTLTALHMRQEKNWQVAYSDNTSVLFVKKNMSDHLSNDDI
jgi:hypothetical protein